MTGPVEQREHEARTFGEVAPRIAAAHFAERERREGLRWHIHCGACRFTWWAEGKVTAECPQCGSTHLREASATEPQDLFECGVCGADYGQPCKRQGAS